MTIAAAILLSAVVIYYAMKEMNNAPEVCNNCRKDCTKCPYEEDIN